MSLVAYDGTTPSLLPLPQPSTSVERRRAAALGGGGRAGRDGDAVDISVHRSPTTRLL